MNVLHLSTFDFGGAGNAAVRIHQSLLERGYPSKMLIAYPRNQFSQCYKFESRFSIISKAIKKIKYSSAFWNERERFNNLTLSRTGYFSFIDNPYFRCHQELYDWADIIHLHWVSDFVDLKYLFEKCKSKKIVWTLHDMNPFTGGCHYSGNCMKYETDCIACHQIQFSNFPKLSEYNLLQKSKIFSGVSSSQLKIVTPSEWLSECSKRSLLFKNFSHEVIPYGLNTEIFTIKDKFEAKKSIGIDTKKKVLLFVSENLSNTRKGFDLLVESLRFIDRKDEIMICSVGAIDPSVLPEGIEYRSMGMVKSEEVMASIYNASDFFVIPAREDNFPNVVIEAHACGLPVVGFATGGIKEMIDPGTNGLLAERESTSDFRDKILYMLNNHDKFDRNSIRQKAIEKYSLEFQAIRYVNLYNSINRL
ncbi:MAG: glycosyltransferase [Cytophagaceae bacterium]